MKPILDRFLEQADRLDSDGERLAANTVSKAVVLAASGQKAKAYLILAKVASNNKVIATLLNEFRDLMSGVSIKSLQNTAHAASILESVALVPTYLPNRKVGSAFIELDKYVRGLPPAFADELKPFIESIRDDVNSPMTPELSHKISSAASRIRNALSPSRLIHYQKGLPMPSSDPKEKMVMDAISNLRETNIPEEQLPGLLTKLKITKSTEEALRYIEKSPPPVKPPEAKPPEPTEAEPEPTAVPEKIRPAPESKEKEKIISPGSPPTTEPVKPPSPQYPSLKAVEGIMSILETCFEDNLIILVSSLTEDPEKMSSMQVPLRNAFLDFATDRISNTNTTDTASRIRVEKETEALVSEFLNLSLKDLPKDTADAFSRSIGELVSLDVKEN